MASQRLKLAERKEEDAEDEDEPRAAPQLPLPLSDQDEQLSDREWAIRKLRERGETPIFGG
jgi:hypothetical protein